MMLTTKARYAVMSMVDLAKICGDNSVNLATISERQNIAKDYLEQIFAKLKKSGLVKSRKGPGGGYCLAHSPHSISILDIIESVEESTKMTRCDGQISGCMPNGTKCVTHELWQGLTDHIILYFKNISLDDVCNKKVKGNNL